jgi:hypothetical protein
MENRPIPVSEANAMIQEYIKYELQHNIDPTKQTQSVSFKGAELMKWLSESMPHADELRVCFGSYPAGTDNAGRVTVILWPYKNGEPANQPVTEGKDGGGGKMPPYNQGGLQP